MHKKTMVTVITLGVLALIGVGVASAQGLHGFGFGLGNNATPEEIATQATNRFQAEADLLGTDINTVKNAWAEGKTLSDLATQLGIDQTTLQQKLMDQRQTQLKANLQSMVDQGVITQGQADQRLQHINQQTGQAKNLGEGHIYGHHRGGMNMGL